MGTEDEAKGGIGLLAEPRAKAYYHVAAMLLGFAVAMISARECGKPTVCVSGGGILLLGFQGVPAPLKPPHSSCLAFQVSGQDLPKPDGQKPAAAPGQRGTRSGAGGVMGGGGGSQGGFS